MRFKTLADLHPLQEELSRRAAAQATAREVERQRLQRLDREARLFELAVGPVQPLRDRRLAIHPRQPVSPNQGNACWTKTR